MSDKSGIEWTDATWNPLVGCTKVSVGCDHCYAESLVNRFAGKNKGFPNRFDIVTIRPDRFLTQPLRWRDPKRIFVNSLADLFHADVPDEFIVRVFAVMALAPQHTFQLLTKRHARLRTLLSTAEFRVDVMNARTLLALDHRLSSMEPMLWPLPNVWLGVSVENQQWADIRIPALLDTPATVRFISAEPLLGPIVIPAELLDWVIVGGESGHGARPMHPEWARRVQYQCELVGTPFLFKQWGEWSPYSTGGVRIGDICMSPDGDTYTVDRDYICAHNESDGTWMRRVGKKAAGRELERITYDGYPDTVTA